jgi:UDP-N-acetylmuramyl pentapeptide phosphotransferase/UDP-N-acetylglucosamine-1-phosphate transferase
MFAHLEFIPLFTLVCVVGVINAFNMIDGIAALAGE